jgi:hypothetical protein
LKPEKLKKQKLINTIIGGAIIVGYEEVLFGASKRFTTLSLKSGHGTYFKLKKDLINKIQSNEDAKNLLRDQALMRLKKINDLIN